MNIDQKSVVISGGARGIGLGVAEVFLSLGARVTIGALREAGLADALDRLTPLGEVTGIASDVTTQVGCQDLARHAVAKFGTIDVAVANAGVYGAAPIEDVTEEFWASIVDTNLKSAFFTIQSALPFLLAASGVAVTVSSINGLIGRPGGASVYGAAKAAVANLTQQLALELAPKVRVNCVAPGYIETEKLRGVPGSAALIEELSVETPAGRIGTPRDVAGAIVALVENDFITGSVLVVDGGLNAGH